MRHLNYYMKNKILTFSLLNILATSCSDKISFDKMVGEHLQSETINEVMKHGVN